MYSILRSEDTLPPFISRQNNNHNPLPKCPDSPNCIRETFLVSRHAAALPSTVQKVLKRMKADSIGHSNEHSWQAVFTVLIFKDDVTVKIEARKSASLLHIRSASSSGTYDFGVNRRRVNRFMNHLSDILKRLG